jgi:hypothetical protein
MATLAAPVDVRRASGLAGDEVAAWVAAAPPGSRGATQADAGASSAFVDSARLVASLPARPNRDVRERAAADASSR